jgi:hypothetical protein
MVTRRSAPDSGQLRFIPPPGLSVVVSPQSHLHNLRSGGSSISHRFIVAQLVATRIGEA